MKKKIAKTLALFMILSSAMVFSPTTLQVDVVSAASKSTPAAPTAPTPVKTPAKEAVQPAGPVYVVVKGDVLWKIAQKHNTTWQQLAEFNQLKKPNLIFPGQKIRIPSVQAAGTLFKAGTYEASAQGNNGEILVSVIFSDNRIEKINIVKHSETPGLSDPAFEKVPAEIIERQSLDVDVVSGATNASIAVKKATADAVKQAGGENNPLLNVNLDRLNPSEDLYNAAVKAIVKPQAVNGVIGVKSYDELKKALGYYAYIYIPELKEGKFIYVDGSAVNGNTIKLMNDITAVGEKANPKFADGSDKVDVITGATVLVTDNVTIDGNGKTIKGDGYPTFMFTGKMEDFGNGAVEAKLTNIVIDGAAYTAKIGGSLFVAGAATLNLEDSKIMNGTAKAEKLQFNGGGAAYVNSEGLTPDVGRAVLNVRNSTFIGNATATGAGAAIAALNGDVNIYNSTFTGNKSLGTIGSGGAIAMRSTSSLLIDGSTITGNEATISGAGVYIFDGESPQKPGKKMTSTVKAVIKNSIIKDNIAPIAADVAYGRYYSEEYKGDKAYNGLNIAEGNTIGDYKDITFTNLERTLLE